MATESLESIVETLSNLKVVDLAKLKKLLEEKWDVKAAAPAAIMAGPVAGQAPAAPVAEATEFFLVLNEVSADKKVVAIKVVREITGLGLKEAKDIVEATMPKTLKEHMPKVEAEEALKKLEAAGVKAVIKGH